MTLSVDEETLRLVKRHPDVNWIHVAREACRRKARELHLWDELLRQVPKRIAGIPPGAIEGRRQEALKRVSWSGRKDAPYSLAVLAVEAVLWTHDARLAEESGVAVVTTAHLLAAPDP